MKKTLLELYGYGKALIGAIVFVGSIAWGIAAWVNTRNNDVQEVKRNMVDVSRKLNILVSNDSLQIHALEKVSNNVSDLKKSMSAMDRSYVEHLRKSGNNDDVILYLQEMREEIREEIKKKSSYSYLPIVLE